jgi:hypothetical protein
MTLRQQEAYYVFLKNAGLSEREALIELRLAVIG